MTEGYTEWEENYFRMLTLSEERLQGKLEGTKERNYSIAKSMKAENIDIETIKKITGLTLEEIDKL